MFKKGRPGATLSPTTESVCVCVCVRVGVCVRAGTPNLEVKDCSEVFFF